MGAATIRVIRGLGWTLVWAGLFVLAFVAYQLWGTGLITSAEQAGGVRVLEERFDGLRDEPLPPLVLPVTDEGSIDESHVPFVGDGTLVPEASVARGEPLAVITFPTLRTDDTAGGGLVDVDAVRDQAVSHVVWAGEDPSTLRKGPGHYADTPVPGQPGNSAIAGHRTTYGAPFNRLGELRPGDPIVVETAIGRHVYVVRDPGDVHGDVTVGETRGTMVVPPTAMWAVDDIEGSWLTLTTCHPMFSSRQRLIVVAELVEGPNVAYVAQGGV